MDLTKFELMELLKEYLTIEVDTEYGFGEDSDSQTIKLLFDGELIDQVWFTS